MAPKRKPKKAAPVPAPEAPAPVQVDESRAARQLRKQENAAKHVSGDESIEKRRERVEAK